MVLPKSMRLQGHRCFDHLYKEGLRYHEPSILLRVVKAESKFYKRKDLKFESKTCRCAIAISSKVSKKAVIRNRLRRLIHQHLREKLYGVSGLSNKWALFSLKPQSSSKEPKQLLKECDRLLLKAGFLP
ncbi:ribonuclease P protein component [Prochlorococcus sp. MIT 1307]|uniref:ribonuclease P protein component n=1 Tax=Prochlorococcus sp. MIT 1307 TaxID=3096219 RepID=UPI002A74FA10|nr:ribonuclease P protein component [Prochlorococcus sp. MIT 1307]